MLARLSALVIWGLVALTVVFWGLRLGARTPAVPRNAVAVGEPALRGDLTRLFGTPPVEQPVAAVQPEMASRFKLLGVIATNAAKKTGRKGPSERSAANDVGAFGRYGIALIAIDGSPAKAFAVGARVDDELVLQSVSARGASIGPAQGAPGRPGDAAGNSALRLELPPLQPAATGTLPPPMAAGPAPSVNFSPGSRRARGLPQQMPMPMQSGQPSEAPPPEMLNNAPTE